MTSYEQQLQDEANLWGAVDEAHATTVPPDWRYHRDLRHNAIMHTADIDALLSHITPHMQVLELGCASGWLSLAAAQRGAQVLGLDVSERSLAIGRAYYESVQDTVAGTVDYRAADLNTLQLEPNRYDIIFTKGTLHHLVGMAHVIETVYAALKPGGLFWISDQDGDESLPAALLAGGLMLLLPTSISYREKFGGLAKFGVSAPSRIKASMEAEGLSPFEGAGRDHDWLALVNQQFRIERIVRKPAITGYIAHQLAMPEAPARALLGGLRTLDGALVRAGLLRTTGVIVYARK